MNKKSFTLAEIVISMVVISVLGSIGVTAALEGVDAWMGIAQRKELIADGRFGAERILREIRMVRNTTSVIAATQTSFRFVDTNNKDITFSFNSGLISRAEVGTGTNGLLGNVASFTFTYYDTNNLEIASPILSPSATNIKRVKVSLSLSKTAGQAVYLESSVKPRNL